MEESSLLNRLLDMGEKPPNETPALDTINLTVDVSNFRTIQVKKMNLTTGKFYFCDRLVLVLGG